MNPNAAAPSTTRAFSLVELSIVLVILGLLVGGILSGQSLIRAAELRAVSTEYQRYFTASQTFRDKYFALPGDFNAATRFWGRMNGNADCVTNSAAAVAATGACDGNGDGMFTGVVSTNQSGEVVQFWRHLANAGLIEGTYTGLSDGVSNEDSIPGTNVPRSKLGNAGWSMVYTLSNPYGAGPMYLLNYNVGLLEFGASVAASRTTGPVLKPEEAWNIDTKMDDGLPGQGKVIARYLTTCANAASNTDYASTYRLTDSTVQCSLYFRNMF